MASDALTNAGKAMFDDVPRKLGCLRMGAYSTSAVLSCAPKCAHNEYTSYTYSVHGHMGSDKTLILVFCNTGSYIQQILHLVIGIIAPLKIPGFINQSV